MNIELDDIRYFCDKFTKAKHCHEKYLLQLSIAINSYLTKKRI